MATNHATKTPRKIIFAGANIAFGVSFIGIELLALLYGASPADPDLQVNMNILMVGINLLGGYIGGYLAAKNTQGDALQHGTLVGVLAYIIQQIVHATLYGWGNVGNAYTTIAIIGGAVIGAILFESQRKRHMRIRSKALQANGEGNSNSSNHEAGQYEDEQKQGKPI
jgi:putative membrane protein (TIGR04086 family)